MFTFSLILGTLFLGTLSAMPTKRVSRSGGTMPHPDTIRRNYPTLGESDATGTLHPSQIYWDNSVNVGRVWNGVLDPESWGNPASLIPLLAMGWNNTHNVPVIRLDAMPNAGDIIAKCLAERISERDRRSNDPDKVGEQSYLASDRADYENTYFANGEPITPVVFAIGGFRRASIIHNAIGQWVRQDSKKRAYSDYLVSVAVNPVMDDEEILNRLTQDNSREGQKDYSVVSYVRLAKRHFTARKAKGVILSGEDFRRIVGIPAERRSVWQKIEAIIKLDDMRPEAKIVDRLVADKTSATGGDKDKKYQYDSSALIPFSALPGYKEILTLAGGSSSVKGAGGKVKEYTFPDDKVGKGYGLSVGVPAPLATVDKYLTDKLNAEKEKLLTDNDVRNNLFPKIKDGKNPVDDSPLANGDKLAELIGIVLDRKPEAYARIYEIWSSVQK